MPRKKWCAVHGMMCVCTDTHQFPHIDCNYSPSLLNRVGLQCVFQWLQGLQPKAQNGKPIRLWTAGSIPTNNFPVEIGAYDDCELAGIRH